MQKKSVRNLVVVLGDQLNRDSSAFDDFDKREDAVWMAEVAEESTHVWSHKQRIALFLAGMRHFRNELEKDGVSVFYRELPVRGEGDGLGSCLEEFCRSLRPKKIIWVLPGDLRVSAILEKACSRQKIPFEVRSDRTFFSTPEDFASFAR